MSDELYGVNKEPAPSIKGGLFDKPWSHEGANGLIYAVSVAEMERLAYGGFKDARGGEIFPNAFPKCGELAWQKVRALLKAAGEKWGSAESVMVGSSVQVSFGFDMGVDPVGFTEPISVAAYVNERSGARLCEASSAKPAPTKWLSCEMLAPVRIADLPEEMLSNIELVLALQEGRLRIAKNIRAGVCVTPSGKELPALALWGSVGVRLRAGSSGFKCSKLSMDRINMALAKMPNPPTLKEARALAAKLDAADQLKADRPARQTGSYACLAIHLAMVGSTEKALSHYSDSAAEAIVWAEAQQGVDAEVRLGSPMGACLLKRAWRRVKDDGLTVAPYTLSIEQALASPARMAELMPTLGADADFDRAWSAFKSGGGGARPLVAEPEAPEASKGVRVKPRAGS